MPNGNEILIFVAFAGLVVALALYARLQARRRREALQRLANRLGLQFDPTVDHSTMSRRYGHIDFLGRGKNRYSFNHLRGVVEGRPVLACDYHYQTETRDSKGRKSTQHHYFGVVFLELPIRMSEVRIRPEGWIDKLAGAIGFDDIDFESAEFSRKFYVAARERRFAYDLIHPQAMEYLLGTDDFSWEFEGGTIALYKLGKLEVEEIPKAIETAVNFVKYIPPHVWADRGTAAKKSGGNEWDLSSSSQLSGRLLCSEFRSPCTMGSSGYATIVGSRGATSTRS